MKKKTKTPATAGKKPESILDQSIFASIRQGSFPSEFRIAELQMPVTFDAPSVPLVVQPPPAPPPSEPRIEPKTLAELANTLWYLKTKFFKRKWEDLEAADDDPRVRRAISRINRCSEELLEAGFKIEDPTGERYRAGSEGMMRPVQLLPTDGITMETVSDTVTPLIYRNGTLFQRGEVFVATPKAAPETQPESQAPLPVEEKESAASEPAAAPAEPTNNPE